MQITAHTAILIYTVMAIVVSDFNVIRLAEAVRVCVTLVFARNSTQLTHPTVWRHRYWSGFT